jgi:NOL1/NOP2/fmu family ribosome biogenesis protein
LFGARALKDGGTMVYSTCTYSYEENEKVIYEFLKNHQDFSLIDAESKIKELTDDGKPQWLEKDYPIEDFYKKELLKIRRIFPHKNLGEGHTVAILKNNNIKSDEKMTLNESKLYNSVYKELSNEQQKQWDELNKSIFTEPLKGIFVLYGNRIVMLPKIGLNVNKVNIVKYGVDVAVFEKNRIEPHHNLATSADFSNIKNKVVLKKDSIELKKYLSGQELITDSDFIGWGIVCVEKYPLGLIKCSQDEVGKNHFPKGLRI